MMGGGNRSYTGFNTATQTYNIQLLDQTQLRRTGDGQYNMISPDGSVRYFTQSDGSTGTSRKIFLTKLVDPSGNAVTMNYPLPGTTYPTLATGITDAIGQTTTFTFTHMHLVVLLLDDRDVSSFMVESYCRKR
jgi:hypothetical protein